MPEWIDTVLTVDAAGNIGANFTGHVHATGLQLDAIPGGFISAAQRIEWDRTNDGALVASVWAAGDNLIGGTAGITAQNVDDSREARLGVVAGPVGDPVKNTLAYAYAQGNVRNILRGDGTSDFQFSTAATRLVTISNFSQAPGFNIIGPSAAVGDNRSPTWNAATGQMTLVTAGYYLLTMFCLTNAPTAAWQAKILKGATNLAYTSGGIGGFWESLGTASCIYKAAANDVIDFRYQQGPNPLNFTGGQISATLLGT